MRPNKRRWNSALKKKRTIIGIFPSRICQKLKLKVQNESNDGEVINLELIHGKLRELPQAKRKRFIEEYGFDAGDAYILTEDRDLSYFVEQILSELRAWLGTRGEAEGTNEEIWNANKKRLSRLAANWLINRFLKILNDQNKNIHTGNVTPENFAEFLTFFEQKQINSTTAQALL